MNNINSMNEITKVGNIRLYLHQYFYNTESIGVLTDLLNKALPIFNLEYSPNDKTFIIKIKKTDIKQFRKDFNHTSMFYYPIMDGIFFNLFHLFSVDKIFNSVNIDDKFVLDFFNNINCMKLLYNITTESDNIIIITL